MATAVCQFIDAHPVACAVAGAFLVLMLFVTAVKLDDMRRRIESLERDRDGRRRY